MREITKTIWVSFDDQEFDSASDCRTYERANIHVLLVNRTREQIEAAINRSDPELADAIEQIGLRIRQSRIAAGDLKRERRKTEASAETEAVSIGYVPPGLPPAASDKLHRSPGFSTDDVEWAQEEPEMPDFLNRNGTTG